MLQECALVSERIVFASFDFRAGNFHTTASPGALMLVL